PAPAAPAIYTLSLHDALPIFRGMQGRSLRDTWAEGACAYLGMQVPGFPNFFLLYGPNTNLGHNSIIAMLETQIDYILQGVQTLRDRKSTRLNSSHVKISYAVF